MLNKVFLIGRAAADPLYATFQSGLPYTRFDIAINERKADGTQSVVYIPIRSFGKAAELVRKYVRKGRKLLIEGRIDTTNWTDDRGNKRKLFLVISERILFLDSSGQAAQETQPDEDPFGDADGDA